MLHTRTQRTLLLVGAALLGLSTLTWVLWPGESSQPEQPFEAAELAPRKSAPQPPDKLDPPGVIDRKEKASQLASMWPGVYDLSYELTVGGPTANDGIQTGTWSIQARLTVGENPKKGMGRDVLVGRLSQVRIKADESVAKNLGLDLTTSPQTFTAPFLIHTDGEALEVVGQRFEQTMPVPARNLISTLVRTADLDSQQEAKTKTSWTTTERVAGADLEVSYTRVAPRTFERTWVFKDAAAPTQGQAPPALAEASNLGRITLGKSGELEHFAHTLKSHVQIQFDKVQPATTYTTYARTELTRRGGAPKALAWARGLNPGMMNTWVERPGARSKTLETKVTMSAEAALSDVTQKTLNNDIRGRGGPLEQLIEHVRRDPELAKALDTQLRQPEANTAGFDVRSRVEALISARTAQSLSLVAGLVRDQEVAPRVRQTAAVAAVFIEEPGEELVESLRQTAQGDLQDKTTSTALIALSGMARTQMEYDQELAKELAASLRERAKEGLEDADLPHTKLWLRVLGNLGEKETWPLVKPYLTHESPRVQELAHRALRFIHTAPARQALARAIMGHQIEDVRKLSIKAAAHQPQQAMQDIVVRAMHEDKSRKVRLAAAQTIGGWGFKSPILHEEIARAAKRDPHPALRRMLRDYKPTFEDTGGARLIKTTETRRPLDPLNPPKGDTQ